MMKRQELATRLVMVFIRTTMVIMLKDSADQEMSVGILISVEGPLDLRLDGCLKARNMD